MLRSELTLPVQPFSNVYAVQTHPECTDLLLHHDHHTGAGVTDQHYDEWPLNLITRKKAKYVMPWCATL